MTARTQEALRIVLARVDLSRRAENELLSHLDRHKEDRHVADAESLHARIKLAREQTIGACERFSKATLLKRLQTVADVLSDPGPVFSSRRGH